jgi:hypothetical protein
MGYLDLVGPTKKFAAIRGRYSLFIGPFDRNEFHQKSVNFSRNSELCFQQCTVIQNLIVSAFGTDSKELLLQDSPNTPLSPNHCYYSDFTTKR